MLEINGKRFVAWAKDRRPSGYVELDDNLQRHWREYEAGRANPTEKTADSICCVIGLHIGEIPEDIYLPQLPLLIRHLIVRDLRAGFWPTEVANLLELPLGTVRRFA